MKYLSNLLAIAFCVLALQSSKANLNSAYVYTIHIGAFDKAQLSDFDDVRSVGYVYAYQLKDDLIQVFLGGYESRKSAQPYLKRVKQNGYPDAYLMRRALDEGDEIATVQIALKTAGQDIEWAKYLQAGKIYISQNNNELRVLTGQYSTTALAQKRANQLRKMGFDNAFVKTINTVQLLKVTEFETGAIEAEPIVVNIDTPKGGEIKEEIPESYDVLFKKAKTTSKGSGKRKVVVPDDIPDSYEVVTKRIEPKKKVATNLPNIRLKVKRTSAIELQKVLKAEDVYNSGLDGYYGKGTAKGYTTIKKENQQIKKYLFLSNAMENDLIANTKLSRLQNIINNLLEDSADAASLLKAERSPIAKAYRAYILFETNGAQDEVNRLMNAAIQQSFKGKKLKNAPPFDYNATYSYENIDQLLKHLNYIHAVSNDAEVPCWIFSQHPKVSAKAFAAAGGNVNTENCGSDFMGWEETKLLKTIAADLDPAYGSDKDMQALYASKRARLFIAPLKMTTDETKEISAWHKTLWSSMNEWSNSDPIHEQRVVALKVAYFQSQVRIEDYFMNKGYTYKEAKPLAMCVLQTIVGTHFVNYMKG